MELKRQISHRQRVLELDLPPPLDQRAAQLVGVHHPDEQGNLATTPGQGREDRQLWVGHRKPRCVDHAEHPDDGLLTGQPIGDDLVADQQRQDVGIQRVVGHRRDSTTNPAAPRAATRSPEARTALAAPDHGVSMVWRIIVADPPRGPQRALRDGACEATIAGDTSPGRVAGGAGLTSDRGGPYTKGR